MRNKKDNLSECLNYLKTTISISKTKIITANKNPGRYEREYHAGDIINPFIDQDKNPSCPFCSGNEKNTKQKAKKPQKNEKRAKWYKRKPFKSTLCWVSDFAEKPTEKNGLRKVITGYDKNRKFRFESNRLYWKYVTPIPIK